jgi:hypothetical protein
VSGRDAVGDIAVALLQIVIVGLTEGERPLAMEEQSTTGPFAILHHIPYVPTSVCCTAPADDGSEFGYDGSLSISVAGAFPSLNFPARRSIGDQLDVGGRPSADFWIRLWRCFPTIDSQGQYDIRAATDATYGLYEDLVVIWAALQRALCQKDLSDVLPGCQSAVLWEARPIRIQGGCAGWDFHVIASWIPLRFPAVP